MNSFSIRNNESASIENNTHDNFPDIDKDTLKVQVNDRYRQDTKLRKIFSIWTFVIISTWIVATFVLLFFNSKLEIDNSVYIALLTTTTANIIGLPLVVLKGLFK